MPEAVVVGAGPGGLATAAMLQRAGIETVVVDRADSVGSAWRGHYERLHLHTVRWLSHLPGYRIPRRYGPWVARADVVRYLESYCSHHRLEVLLTTEVSRIERDDDGWIVRSPQGDLTASYVVVATGHNHTPELPPWPGKESFTGELLHAGAYRNATPYVGKDVLVVGVGNTGAEIAMDLVETGAGRVRVAVRTPPHIIARQQGPVVNPMLGVAVRHLPARVLDPVARRIRRATLGDLSPYGLPEPRDGLVRRILRDDAIPLIDAGFLDMLKAGAYSVVPAVTSFEGGDVALADGSRISPDAVIAATGYRRGLEPLVGHLGVLREDGRPRVRGGDTDPGAPNLWFTGYTNPISGMFRELGLDAKRIARAVVRHRSFARTHPLQANPRLAAVVDTLRVSAPGVVPGKEPVRP
jgi:putative flavoprotein involved in K+ transport